MFNLSVHIPRLKWQGSEEASLEHLCSLAKAPERTLRGDQRPRRLDHPFILASEKRIDVVTGRIHFPVNTMQEALEVMAALARGWGIEGKASLTRKFFDLLLQVPVME